MFGALWSGLEGLMFKPFHRFNVAGQKYMVVLTTSCCTELYKIYLVKGIFKVCVAKYFANIDAENLDRESPDYIYKCMELAICDYTRNRTEKTERSNIRKKQVEYVRKLNSVSMCHDIRTEDKK